MEENVGYHFAPQELYILFAIGIACYTITISRYPPPKPDDFVGGLIDIFLLISWTPLALYYVGIVFGLPPARPVDQSMPGEAIDPRDIHEVTKYIAYYAHIIMIFLFFLWIAFLWKIRYDEHDESSKE